MQNLTNTPAYLDAHCAGWMGETYPTEYADGGIKQQAADRGYLDGARKREAALRGR